MRDPFKPNSNKQLIREAQFGFAVIGLLIATLIYVAWYRLNGLHDHIPQHVRDSPVAVQVYPNSPNYDQETHQMVSRSERSAPSSEEFSKPPIRAELTNAPRRVMSESQRTARSLSKSADSIDKSVTKVASLIKPPSGISTGSSVNPATAIKGDSGFKILKAQGNRAPVDSNGFKTVAIPKLPDRNGLKGIDADFNPPKPFEANVIASKSSDSNTFKPKSVQPEPTESANPLLPKISTPKVSASNEFKPLGSPAKLELPKQLPLASSTNKPLTSKPVVTKPGQSEFNALLPRIEDSPADFQAARHPKTEKVSSDFSPLNTYKAAPGESPLKMPSLEEPVSTETEPSSFKVKPKPDSNTRQTSRIPKLPNQSLASLRSEQVETPDVKVQTKSKTTVKPVSFEASTWTVKKGDSFWSIAQSNYGDGRFFRALYEFNRRKVPGFEDLGDGIELDIPTEQELIRKHSDLCPADAVHKNDPWRATPNDLMSELTVSCNDDLSQRLYETKAGDTLFEIARRQLGQASRYAELFELNRFRIGKDVSHESELPVGIKILLPEN